MMFLNDYPHLSQWSRNIPKPFQPGTFTSPAARALTRGAAAGTAARAPQRARPRPGASRGAAAHAAWPGVNGGWKIMGKSWENHGKIMIFPETLQIGRLKLINLCFRFLKIRVLEGCGMPYVPYFPWSSTEFVPKRNHRWSTVIPGLKLHHSSGMLLCKWSVLISEPPGKSFEYRVILCHTMSFYCMSYYVILCHSTVCHTMSYYVILCHTAKTISDIKSRMPYVLNALMLNASLRWTWWKISRSLDLWLPLGSASKKLLELWAGFFVGHGMHGASHEVRSLRWKNPGKNHLKSAESRKLLACSAEDLRRLLGQGNQWTSRGQQTRKLLAWLHGWNSSPDNCGPNVSSEPGQVEIFLPITTYMVDGNAKSCTSWILVVNIPWISRGLAWFSHRR